MLAALLIREEPKKADPADMEAPDADPVPATNS
jgi:hypothetical protein